MENQDSKVNQAINDHRRAIDEAIDIFDRKQLLDKSNRIAIEAEANSRGVPYETVAKEWAANDPLRRVVPNWFTFKNSI